MHGTHARACVAPMEINNCVNVLRGTDADEYNRVCISV